jgi:hypothetical protein
MTRRARFAWLWVAIGIAWVGLFSLIEGLALVSDDALTLSRFTYEISRAWPPIVFLLGLTVGVLAEHFWRWLEVDLLELGRLPMPWQMRIALLAIAWSAVIVLTGGGVGVFLAGVALGLLLTRILWQWDPRNENDRRG